ncbi:similar to Saccharomyces cerevisiae YBL101C ECM21 Protein involved in regulating the endocytosis of plasma membrane proteins [Maudiozyma saulgeensis]|uniref:Similar to Saccharomyces cerevisiae YBL101C ECM21 Protein involved in regulating the endocytosis of plasma membrane proteins n=1 Tax=Maudiozyma saulgeensis TaxID=1789683 RepID=A0A1X7R770_9SACH|nr:similar to Saccharomyces cerevisiae YBL101C ECM21 Protein involved in regulating the endocytosis of plasma membrane proteins [Kazachstania saulgeensis]
MYESNTGHSMSNPDLVKPLPMNTRDRRRSSIKSALSSLLTTNSTTTTTATTTTTSNKISPRKKKINSQSQRNTPSSSSNRRHSTNSIQPSSIHQNVIATRRRNNSHHMENSNPIANTVFDNKRYIDQYLLSRGFVSKKTIINKKNINNGKFVVTVATTGSTIFLPTVSPTDDEYLARLNGLRPEDSEEFLFNDDEDEDEEQEQVQDEENPVQEVRNNNDARNDSEQRGQTAVGTNTSTANGNEQEQEGRTASRSSAATGVQSMDTENSSRIPFSTAIIISTDTSVSFESFIIELAAKVKVFWNNGVPPTKSFNEEFYNAGSLFWSLNSKNFILFVPKEVSAANQIVENNLNNIDRRLFRNTSSSTRNYLDKNKTKEQFLQLLSNDKKSQNNNLKPGTYIFILPVMFANHIPESMYFPSARVNYKIKFGTKLFLSTGSNNKNSSSSSSSSSQISLNSTNSSIRGTEAEQIYQKKPSLNNKSLFSMMKHGLQKLPHQNQKNISPGDSSIDKNNNSSCNGLNLYAEYPLRVVRTPPPVSISTANKPIYINRVWTDSLSYEISFQQKYVSLGSDCKLRLKLAPLTKNISIKRVRVSINEKITFVSKNYEFEYDQIDLVAKDPYNPYYLDFQSKRRKERNLPLLEIRTKDKGSRALREEIIENSCQDNLLSYSSFPEENNVNNNNNKKNKKTEPIGITEEICIDTMLHFPKFEDLDKHKAKIIAPYGIDIFNTELNPEISSSPTSLNGIISTDNNGNNSESHKTTSSSVMGFLANHNPITSSSNNKNSKLRQNSNGNPSLAKKYNITKIKTTSGTEVETHTRLNKPKRGLYLDSLHFSNIHARHKLEIMLRISKPDPMDNSKLRHYEVLIDTPIVIVSELCNSGNMELPTYHMATTTTNNSTATTMNNFVGIDTHNNHDAPPSFEEAISVPGSPLGSPMGSPMGSPITSPLTSPMVSPIGSPEVIPSCDSDLYSIQQINLSRGTTIRRPPSIGSENNININNNNKNANNTTTTQPSNTNERYSNIDRLLTSPSHSGSNSSETMETGSISGSSSTKGSNALFKKNYTINTSSTIEPTEPPHYDDIVKE